MSSKFVKVILVLAMLFGVGWLGYRWYQNLPPRRSADIQMAIGNYDKAIPFLLTAYDQNRYDDSIVLDLAECYDRTGDKTTASRLYQQVWEFMEQSHAAGKYGYHYARAKTLRELGH